MSCHLAQLEFLPFPNMTFLNCSVSPAHKPILGNKVIWIPITVYSHLVGLRPPSLAAAFDYSCAVLTVYSFGYSVSPWNALISLCVAHTLPLRDLSGVWLGVCLNWPEAMMIISHTFQYFRGQCLNRSESPRIKENIPDSFQRLVVYWVSLHNYPLFFRDTYKVYMVSSKTTGQQTEETITIRIVSFLGRHYKRLPRYYLVVYVDIRHSFLVSCTFF